MTMLKTRLAQAGSAVVGAGLALALLPAGSATPAFADASVQSQLAQIRQATDQYHDSTVATAHNYLPFLACFDDPAGGMGQHFLDEPALHDGLDPLHPEVLVYEQKGDRYKLVAVEYVVPGPKSMTPPELLGQTFGYNDDLGVWKLHAWIWRANPAGMFADWNPNVRSCTS